MPGSSVSAAGCHMCHLHSHNHEDLIKTAPLRSSHDRHNYHYGHHREHSRGDDYISRREMAHISRADSLNQIPRISTGHSLPNSRSNSLTRYPREVSIMPDGDDVVGGLRYSSSTRSLDLNPTNHVMFDPRSTSLPRYSKPLTFEQQIQARPEVLVNAAPPRSRANSTCGSLSRNPINLCQDNSHDYYLDMHCKRIKDERKKHRFNVQTVMLIGCYTLLVIIAIVVGVFLCYQNGWLGFGSSKSKLSDDSKRQNFNSIEPTPLETLSRQNRPGNFNNGRGNIGLDKGNNNFDRGPIRTQNNKNQNGKSNFGNVPNNNRNIGFSGSSQGGFDNRGNSQVNQPGSVQNSNVNFSPGTGVRLPNIVNTNVRFTTATATRGSTVIRTTPFPITKPNFRFTTRPQVNQFSNVNTVQNRLNTLVGIPLNTNENRFETNSFPQNTIQNQNRPISPVEIPLNTNNNKEIRVENKFANVQSPSLPQKPVKQKDDIKTGNVDTNTIAKTLFQGGVSNIPGQVINPNSNSFITQTNKNNEIKTLFSGQGVIRKPVPTLVQGSSSDPLSGVNVNEQTSLSTQELIDLLAIRRMRDLLNSNKSTKEIIDILRSASPEGSRLENIRGETLNINENTQAKTTPSPFKVKNKVHELQRGGVINLPIQETIQNSRQDIKAQFTTTKPIIPTNSVPVNTPGQSGQEDNLNFGSNHDILRALALSKLVNTTIEGAIINLINRRLNQNKQTTVDPLLDKTGISVVPVHKKSFKTLLESDVKNVQDNIGPLNNQTLRTVQILNRLIEINKQRQLERQNLNLGSLASQRRPRTQEINSVNRKGTPSLKSVNDIPANNSNNSKTIEDDTKKQVSFTNVSSSININLPKQKTNLQTNSFANLQRGIRNPDPSFAVMVRTEDVIPSTSNQKTAVFPPRLPTRSIGKSLAGRRSPPFRENVQVVPGGRSITAPLPISVVRAWTHMDSKGTVSKGKIHSDGSFAFTNCRPAEVCNPARSQNRT